MTVNTRRRNMPAVAQRTTKWAAIAIATESWQRTIRLCVIILVTTVCSIGGTIAACFVFLR